MNIVKNSNYTRIAEGQTGQVAADAINVILDLILGSIRYEFTQDDVINNAINFSHNKNTFNVIPVLYDNNNVKQTVNGLFTLTDANNWKLDVPNALDGTWKLIIIYLP